MRIEIDIFEKPAKLLAQWASPPKPPVPFMAVLAFENATSVFQNFRSDTLDGIIGQLSPILDRDADKIHEWFSSGHRVWSSLREVTDHEFMKVFGGN